MKKLLSLLSVLTISGTAVPTTIAASPYQKEETIKNTQINYSQTNNLESLNRVKRDVNNQNIFFLRSAEEQHKNGYLFYLIYTPKVWEDIIQLKNNSSDFLLFQTKFLEKNYIIFNDQLKYDDLNKDLNYSPCGRYSCNLDTNVLKIYHRILQTKLAANKIWDNWSYIDSEWQKTTKNNRIRIDFSSNSIESFYKYDNEYYENEYLSKLKNDLNIFNLNIIDDDKNETILKAIKDKNPNLDITQIEIVNKNSYSYFSGGFSAKIKVKNNSYKYSAGSIINDSFTFNTKINLNKINEIIKNDSKVKQWIEHLNDYNKNLPKKIEQLKIYTNNQKLISKSTEKEIIKGYIRDWNYVLTLIEHELKLNELDKNIQGLKSDIETLKNKVNDLENRVNNLEQPNNCETHGYVVSGYFGMAALASIPILQEIMAAFSAISGLVAALCGL